MPPQPPIRAKKTFSGDVNKAKAASGGAFGGGAPPPPPPTGGSSHYSVDTALNKIAPKGSYYHQFIPLIKNAAAQWNVDPAQLLSVIVWEGGKANDARPNAAGAIGLAQLVDGNVDSTLNPTRYDEFMRQYGGPNPTSATWAINYVAWRMDGGIRHYPSLNDWYAGTNGDQTAPRGYNPGFKGDKRGAGPQVLIDKGVGTKYTPTIPQSPTQSANTSVTTSQIEQGIKDPWVVGVSKNGKLLIKQSSVQPKNVVMYDGSPMTVSAWKSLTRSLDQYFVSYTGGRPSNSVMLNYINKGWSPYSLSVALAKKSTFFKSPIWKSQAPAYQAAAKGLLPDGQTPSKELVRSAILNNWSEGTFQSVLRKQATYVQSSEFKGNVATLENVHSSIMGTPDQGGLNSIKQAALAGWSADQYAAYLRSQPQYTSSPEYQTKTLNFLQSLGLITGEKPVLKKGPAPENTQPNVAGALPQDSRISGSTDLSRPEDTVATFNG